MNCNDYNGNSVFGGSLFNEIFRALDSTIPSALEKAESQMNKVSNQLRSFAINASESDAGYLVEVNLPGISRESVDISTEDGKLTLTVNPSTVKESYSTAECKDSNEASESACSSEKRYSIKEWADVSGERTLTLPKDADLENISASLDSGILSITISKQEAKKARKVEIH